MNKLFFIAFLAVMTAACGPSKKTIGELNQQRDAAKTATYRDLIYNGYHPLLNETTFRLDSTSVDETYGYTAENPIMVAGELESGAYNQRRFLNALLGPKGEATSFQRRGSCCGFSTPNGIMGGGLLDKYEVKIEGDAQVYTLYLNFYDKGVLKAPKGFTFKK